MSKLTLHDLYTSLPRKTWDYYLGIDRADTIANPFSQDGNHNDFILQYFKRGGKVEIFKSCEIKIESLRIPYHISSVFFLGICLYEKTSLNKRYPLGHNDPGYSTFPFIWFLIALFHDNAYQIEIDKELPHVKNLNQLYQHYSISNSIIDKKITKCPKLSNSREKYFKYILQERKHIDHGILGGILLFDRLCKIREEKKAVNEDNLFWGRKLINQYSLAANAITLHNIWLPKDYQKDLYNKYGLGDLCNIDPINFKEFPLFYILGIVDSIEPLKAYRNEIDNGQYTAKYVLDNVYVTFVPKGIKIEVENNSNLDFNILKEKSMNLIGWLNVEISTTSNCIEISFN